jgi:hypothetical protein
MQRCNACLGEYPSAQADGSLYFHACPPLSSVELAAAVVAGKVALPAGETAAQAVLRRVYERAGARDENVSGERDANGKALPTREGDGRIPVADPPPDRAPVVIVGR